ncbi:cation transporter [Aquabacterium sp. NJ1]|nr:cation transporter [Aquabacterium sp. NJ1]
MTTLWLTWLQFLICVAVIGFAGVRLSRYGDAIASLTGLSRNWIGLILIGTVTSLPELVTGMSAVTAANAPDIAMGDALGSCVFNLAILALIDVLYRKQFVYRVASSEHMLSAAFSIILLAGAAFNLLMTRQNAMPIIGHISLGSVALLVMYLVTMRALYLAEQRHANARPGTKPEQLSMKAALMGYSISSAVIIAAGVWLPFVGVELARVMGWSHSFVGSLFVAFATSVPELATTWGALRVGAIDMALGNLLGSNLFDVMILALDDIAYRAGSIYQSVSPVHAVSAVTACMMSAAVIVALAYRPVSRVWHTASWASLSLLALYLLNAMIQFLHGH